MIANEIYGIYLRSQHKKQIEVQKLFFENPIKLIQFIVILTVVNAKEAAQSSAHTSCQNACNSFFIGLILSQCWNSSKFRVQNKRMWESPEYFLK